MGLLQGGRQVSEDITTRLRRDCMSLIADEAADEIERLRKERDEARFAAAYQYAKHHNGDVQTLMDNFCALKGWQKTPLFVGDDDHAKMEADSNNELFRKGQI